MIAATPLLIRFFLHAITELLRYDIADAAELFADAVFRADACRRHFR